jgi:hypothetical protein
MNPNPFLGMSRTSLQGYLSLAVIVLLQLAAVQLPSTLASPGDAHIWLWVTFGASTLAGILKLIIARGAGDAPANPPAPSSTLAKALIAAILLGCGASVAAQTASTGNGFSAASGPCGLYTKQAWSACSFTATAFDFADLGATKSTHVFILNNDLLAPGVFSVYTGGLGVQPNLSGLLSKTNVTPGSLQLGFDATGGVGIPVGGQSVPTWLAGGVFSWQITPNLQWNTIQAHYGAVGTQQFAVISTQLEYLFNPSAQSVAAAQAKRVAKAQKTLAKQGITAQ